MADEKKISTETPVYDEKNAAGTTHGDDLVNSADRTGSVAMNIVENPLKVNIPKHAGATFVLINLCVVAAQPRDGRLQCTRVLSGQRS